MELSERDAQDMDIKNGDRIKISSRRGSIEIQARITNRVSPGMVFVPMHYREAAANIITNDALDPTAKIPELKVCAVKITK